MQTATATRTASKKSAAVTTRPARKPSVNSVYVAALKEAGGFHKSSFHIEMAVCLAFYNEHEKADLNAKKLLRPIYEKAGYDCKNPQGDDYKTVQRRISVAADLFSHVGGQETVYDWMDREVGAKGIAVLVKELEKHKLDNISLVKAYVGKPAVRTYTRRQPTDAEKELANRVANTPITGGDSGGTGQAKPVVVQTGPQLRRAQDQLPPERVLRTDHIVCAIPMDATQDEIKALALKLLEFATTQVTTPQPATVQ